MFGLLRRLQQITSDIRRVCIVGSVSLHRWTRRMVRLTVIQFLSSELEAHVAQLARVWMLSAVHRQMALQPLQRVQQLSTEMTFVERDTFSRRRHDAVESSHDDCFIFNEQVVFSEQILRLAAGGRCCL